MNRLYDMRASVKDRFWSKVDKSAGPDKCWIFQAKSNPPYGRFWFEGQNRIPSVVSFILNGGLVPEGMCVLHTCDNPPCVNPLHFWLGTQTQNQADKVGKGRHRTRAWKIPECQTDNYGELKGW